jgi:hypothetical protein
MTRVAKIIRNWRNDDESDKTIQYYLECTLDFYKPSRKTAPGTPASEKQKVIEIPLKNNLGKMVSNLTYQIVENEHGVPYIQWLGENSHTLKTLFGNTSLTRQQGVWLTPGA